jgi:hypothetical protein
MIANDAPEPALPAWLSRIVAAVAEPSQLVRALQEFPPGQLPAAPVAAPGAGYGRALLHQDARLELMHAGWETGGRAEPHDHGAGRGAVLVLSGHFVETVWRLEARGGSQPQTDVQLCAVMRREHETGSVMEVEPQLIHSLEACAPGATLHVYAPPVTGMRVYDREKQQRLTLSDECGAWLPSDARQVQARCSFREAWHGER